MPKFYFNKFILLCFCMAFGIEVVWALLLASVINGIWPKVFFLFMIAKRISDDACKTMPHQKTFLINQTPGILSLVQLFRDTAESNQLASMLALHSCVWLHTIATYTHTHNLDFFFAKLMNGQIALIIWFSASCLVSVVSKNVCYIIEHNKQKKVFSLRNLWRESIYVVELCASYTS